MPQPTRTLSVPQASRLAELQTLFSTEIEPRIRRMARRWLWRSWYRPEEFDSTVQDARGLAWVFVLRADADGKPVSDITGLIARNALRAARDGRAVDGSCKEGCAMTARRRGRTRQTGAHMLGLLVHRRQSAVPALAVMAVDFPRWLSCLPENDSRLALSLILHDGHSVEVAERLGVAVSTVAKKKQSLCQSWRRFTGQRRPRYSRLRRLAAS